MHGRDNLQCVGVKNMHQSNMIHNDLKRLVHRTYRRKGTHEWRRPETAKNRVRTGRVYLNEFYARQVEFVYCMLFIHCEAPHTFMMNISALVTSEWMLWQLSREDTSQASYFRSCEWNAESVHVIDDMWPHCQMICSLYVACSQNWVAACHL